MKEYEIIIETINPCGGECHSQQEIIEAENPDGDVVIVTGDGNGYMVRYTFTE